VEFKSFLHDISVYNMYITYFTK